MPVKISQLAGLSLLDPEDRFAMVDDPSGSPVSVGVEYNKIVQKKLLYDVTLASASSFEITNISQDYDDLHIFAKLRTDQAAVASTPQMWLNNYTDTNNYHWTRHISQQTTHLVDEANSNFIGRVAGNTATTGTFAWVKLIVPFYAKTNRHKFFTSESVLHQQAGVIDLDQIIVQWNIDAAPSTPITRLDITGSSGIQFVAESRVRVIGVKYGA